MAKTRTTERGEPGRPRLPDRFVAGVASDYVRALKLRLPPVEYVAAQRLAPVVRARNWVHLARVRGFLVGATKAGISTGRMSAKARRVLGRITQR